MPSTRIKPFQQEPVCLTSHFVRRPLPDRCRTRPARPIHPTAGAGGSVAGRSGDSKRWPAHIFHPPPRTSPITKWRNDAVPRMRSAADAPESYAPATFSRPVFPPRRRPGPRRRGPPVGRSGCGRAASPRPEPPQGSRGPTRRRRLPRRVRLLVWWQFPRGFRPGSSARVGASWEPQFFDQDSQGVHPRCPVTSLPCPR